MSTIDSQLLFGESFDATITTSGVANAVTLTNTVYIPQVKDHTGTARNDRAFLNKGLCFNAVVEDTDWVGSGAVVLTQLYEHTASGSVVASGNMILQATTTLAGAEVVEGTQICSIPLPTDIIEPFLAVGVSSTTALLSAGAITCWIGPPIQQGGSHGAL